MSLPVTATPLPRCYAETTNASKPAVLWVKTGGAQVRLDGQKLTLKQQEGLLFPAGATYQITTDVDSVALMMQLPMPLALAETRCFRTGADSGLALLYGFSQQLNYLQHDDAFLLQLANTLLQFSSPLFQLPSGLQPPPVPQNSQLRQVLTQVMQDHKGALPVGELAGQAMMSPRSLQRTLVRETGLSAGQWRRQWQLNQAAMQLLAGKTISWAQSAAGYSSASGFIRAFQRASGLTPSEFLASHAGRDVEATRVSVGEAVVEKSLPLPEAAWTIPARRTWPRVNRTNVAVWVYRGQCEVTIADHTYSLVEGQALVLPAGVPNMLQVGDGDLVLPVGYSSQSAALFQSVSVVNVGLELSDYFLHCMACAYTPLRYRGFRPETGVKEILARVQGQSLPQADIGVVENAGEVESETVELASVSPVKVNNRWARQAQLSHARELLSAGHTPTEASRLSGYAHVSGFTRAFTQLYGVSPRQFASSLCSQADWRRADDVFTA